MSIKISDFVIQYQDSEGLRRSIPQAVELITKERKETEQEIAYFSDLLTQKPRCKIILSPMLTSLNADLQKIEHAEAILVRLGYRADTGAWKMHA